MKLPILTQLLLAFSLFANLSCTEPAQSPDPPIASIEAEANALDGSPLFPPKESAASKARKDSLLAIAKQDFEKNQNVLNHHIWLGRRTAYLSKYQESIKIYSAGLEKFPNSPELYRHRGHRYISIRQFDKAIADFEKAAALAIDRPLEIEPDGIPNSLNIPLSNLHFNIWYHWALAWYLKGNFEKAAKLYEECLSYSVNPDLLCATSDWLYMTYKRQGEQEKAASILETISKDMEIIENHSYHKRLLFYKGLIPAEDLLHLESMKPEDQLDIVTQGYGVGNWYLYNNDQEKAKNIFNKMLTTSYWPAFGYIAAEADLQRMNKN